MTNELGTTLQELEDKAERKKDALSCLRSLSSFTSDGDELANYWIKTIRQYIEQS